MTIRTGNRQRCRSCRKYKGIGGFDSYGKCPACSIVCQRPNCDRERPPLAIEHDDPYCSNICAREEYENPMPTSEYQKGRNAARGT